MNRNTFYYLLPVFIFIAALSQSTITTRLRLLGVKPEVVLLLIVVGAMVYGAKPALIWAFWGGITIDLFSGGPMGSSSLALIGAALVASLGYTTLSRFHILVPIGLTAAATLVYSLVYIGMSHLLAGLGAIVALQSYNIPQNRIPWGGAFETIVIPALFYNSALMLLLTPLLNRVSDAIDVEI